MKPTRLTWMLPLLVLGAAALATAEPELSFHPPEDLALLWGKRIALVMVVAAAALLVFVLGRRRHRLAEPETKWLLFVGLCALPLPVVFVSAGVGMEQSKDIGFCNHCHPMGPFINDMKAPASDTLAAVHYRNRYIQREQCWTCHTDYGIFGTVEAKTSGMVHVYRDATRSYKLPIALHRPYNYAICLNCHAESARFQKPLGDAEAHDGVVATVLKGEGTCLDCHGEAHPPREQRSAE